MPILREAVKPFVLLLLAVSPLVAQPTPAGDEFQVNTYTTGPHLGTDVALDADGNFVVVWDSGSSPEPGPDGDHSSVQAQRYAADGTVQGVEFQVNSYTTGLQERPAVAADALGNFVVVWESGVPSGPGPDGDELAIRGQRFASDGSTLGGEFQVNTFTTDSQRYPQVSSDAAGNFVVVWIHDLTAVRGRRFAADGTALDDEFSVSHGYSTDVAVSANGFIVVWSDIVPTGRRYAADGTALGTPFDLADTPDAVPFVAADAQGDFFVAWSESEEVRGRRFASDGTALGDELQVNTFTTGTLSFPALASDTDGNVVVAWRRFDAGVSSIRAQRIAANNTFLGGEFQVNTYGTSGLALPAVASDADGDLVVVWRGEQEIRGQRFTPVDSADVAISKDDGVTEVLPGSQVVYTIVARNLGPSFTDSVSVTDVFAAELSCSWTSTAEGGALGNSDGSGDLNETLSLPAGSAVTYTATCDVAVDATGTLSNTATISSPLTDPDLSNNSATDSDTMLRIADLSVSQVDTPDPVFVDSTLTYTIQVDNAGPKSAFNVRVTDILPPATTLLDATGASWVCNGTVGIVICGLATLAPGAAPPLTVRVRTPSDEGILVHQVVVSADELDPVPVNNSSVEATTVETGLIFADGFESGDVSSWSARQP